MTEPGTSIATIQYGYDSAGDVKTVTDEVGDTITYTYDADGPRANRRKTRFRRRPARDTAYAYDAAGNLTIETDALGHTTTYDL